MEEKEKHILKQHLVNILEEQVRPNFQKHSHPALDKRLQHGRYVDKTLNFDFHENQAWKDAGSSGYATIDIVEWIIQSASSDQLQPVYHMIAPPILITLDDYDTSYKLRGVRLIQAMLSKVDVTALRKSGLGKVFIESLFQCLTYVHGESSNPDLVQATYQCCYALINVLELEGSKDKSHMYERLLVEGVLLAQISEMLDIQLINMKEIPLIYKEIGITGVQYLKPILLLICQNLQMPYSSIELKKNAAFALLKVIESCKPRIPMYTGQILVCLTSCWQIVQDNQDNDSDGIQQAAETADCFKDKTIQAIFSSPFYRCLQTAKSTANALGLSIFVEYGIGEWYGTARKFYPLPAEIGRLKELFPEIDTSYVPVLATPTGCETMRAVHERVQQAMDKLVKNCDEKYEQVILFGHAASVICCVRALLGDWSFYVNAGTCSISKLQRQEDGSWKLIMNGSTDHLSQGTLRSWMFEGDVPSYEVQQ
ncbi:unnamed protein product [Umbelopsis vinacea]